MGNVIWLVIMIPVSALFTGIGIFAWKRKEPMWFWSGIEVREEEITDVAAYNRENGILWIAFSMIFWISTILGALRMPLGGIALGVGCMVGIPALVIAYGKIYDKYKTGKKV